MTTVGISEMKNRLSEFVRRAREGETILVTEKGRIVAQLTKPSADTAKAEDPLAVLEAEGLITRRGLPNEPSLYKKSGPLLKPGAAASLLDETRGDS